MSHLAVAVEGLRPLAGAGGDEGAETSEARKRETAEVHPEVTFVFEAPFAFCAFEVSFRPARLGSRRAPEGR